MHDEYLDVLLVNGCGISVIDGVCKNSNTKDCVDANDFGDKDVRVCIMKFLHTLEEPYGWRFFFC
jgi:hypothetical protein